MSLIRWFTKNVADTAEGTHADLKPLELPEPPEQAMARVEAAVEKLPRWRVESKDGSVLKATRRTPIMRFVDDVTVTVEPAENGSRVQARSASRLGKGDLGQNRRNILELFGAI